MGRPSREGVLRLAYMYKLARLVGDEWVEHSHPPVYRAVQSHSGTWRVVAGVPSREVIPFERLVLALEPPYLLLYVLHTPRGEGEAGRYQSTPFEAESFRTLLTRFGSYFTSDARFDLWAHSPTDRATVVWDRHNQLFGYGPVERFAEELRKLGYSEGDVVVPVPHQHHYRAEFDPQATDILRSIEWSRSPLLAEDEQ